MPQASVSPPLAELKTDVAEKSAFIAPLRGFIRAAAEADLPLPGICLGGQLLAGFPERFRAFQWHHDSFEIPDQARHLAASERCPGQAFRYRNAYALQFHPEIDAGIVAAWNRQTEPTRDLVTGFFKEASAWHALSLRRLGNFLEHCQLGGPTTDRSWQPPTPYLP